MRDNQPAIDVATFAATFKDFLEEVVQAAPARDSVFRDRLREHFGVDPVGLPVVGTKLQDVEQVNLQVGLDAYCGRDNLETEWLGLGGQHTRYMGLALADLMAPSVGPQVSIGPVEYSEVPSGPESRLVCIQWGLLMTSDPSANPVAVLVRSASEHGPNPGLHLEVMAETSETAAGFLAEVRDLMRIHNVFRGQMVSLGQAFEQGPFPGLGVTFHPMPNLTRDELVLPTDLLDRIERHTIGFAANAKRLAAAGRHLRRGLLLYGPPGTGKTHTVGYLASQFSDRTVLLLTGADQELLSASFKLARDLAPAMVVLEDVDLVADERTMAHLPGRLPLLFALLNELDGLEPDADVLAVLTTNRADLVEPALAARPGRVDLALEIPLPDADCRRRLLDLYGVGLELDSSNLHEIVAATDGVSAAFIKELLRSAAVLAAETSTGAIKVENHHLAIALDHLIEQGANLTAKLLGSPGPDGRPPAALRMPGAIPAEITAQLVGEPLDQQGPTQ